MHAGIGRLDHASPKRYPFRIAVSLRGMESIELAPVGKETRVELDAAWPHPSFIGRFLPTQHQIDGDRFSAVWQASAFASDMARTVQQMQQGDFGRFLSNTFGVSLVNPVDIYQQAERSVKYGVMLITRRLDWYAVSDQINQHTRGLRGETSEAPAPKTKSATTAHLPAPWRGPPTRFPGHPGHKSPRTGSPGLPLPSFSIADTTESGEAHCPAREPLNLCLMTLVPESSGPSIQT